MTNPWFPLGVASDAKFRLLCLPHAGAGASYFNAWGKGFPPDIKVCPVQAPGRERRNRELPFTRVEPLAAELAQAIAACLVEPFALFGHSTGALCVFETARELRRIGGPRPERLFVSGRRAPQVPMEWHDLAAMDVAELADFLRQLGGTPEVVLDDPETLRFLQPLLAADFSLNEQYAYTPEDPLDLPITAFAGIEDPGAGAAEMSPWELQTAAGFRLHPLDGGHFAVFDRAAEVHRAIAADLVGGGRAEQRTPFMQLSRSGAKMASLSGLRLIMEDIATAVSSAADREWLNLGVGNPAAIPEVRDTWQRVTAEALSSSFADVSCRYGPSRGLPELVGAIAEYFNDRYGWDIGPRNIVVGPGSQMLCFAAAALFTGPGEDRDARLVLPMTPDYTGYQGLALHPGGITGVEPIIRLQGERSFRYLFDLPAIERLEDVGLMLLSSPSNPVGRSASPDEIRRLIAAAERHAVPLVVDNAYGSPFPRIGGQAAAPVGDERVVNVFSLSKAGLPGERLGFAIGAERYIDPLVSFLANTTLHAPQLVQAAVARALRSQHLDTLVTAVIGPVYAERRKFVEALLAQSLPADVAWRLYASDGGMFCWLWVDEEWFDDLTFYEALKARGVFVVPGRYFFTDTGPSEALGRHARQCVRVSITPDTDTLAAGVMQLAATLGDLRAGRMEKHDNC